MARQPETLWVSRSLVWELGECWMGLHLLWRNSQVPWGAPRSIFVIGGLTSVFRSTYYQFRLALQRQTFPNKDNLATMTPGLITSWLDCNVFVEWHFWTCIYYICAEGTALASGHLLNQVHIKPWTSWEQVTSKTTCPCVGLYRERCSFKYLGPK